MSRSQKDINMLWKYTTKDNRRTKNVECITYQTDRHVCLKQKNPGVKILLQGTSLA